MSISQFLNAFMLSTLLLKLYHHLKTPVFHIILYTYYVWHNHCIGDTAQNAHFYEHNSFVPIPPSHSFLFLLPASVLALFSIFLPVRCTQYTEGKMLTGACSTFLCLGSPLFTKVNKLVCKRTIIVEYKKAETSS